MEGGGNVRSYEQGHGAICIANVDLDQGLPLAYHWLTSFELERISFPVKSKVETNSGNTIHSRSWTSS
jgi:hypothetical protein